MALPSDSGELLIVLAHVQHENMRLKTEISHCHQRNQREIKELELINQSKVLEIEQKISKLESEGKSREDLDKQEIKHLQQLNLQLSQKLQIKEDQLNVSSREKDTWQDSCQNQLSQLRSTVKEKDDALQDIKSNNIELMEKISSSEKELEKLRSMNHELNITLSSERQQYKISMSRVEEIETQFKTQLSAAKADIEKYKSLLKSSEDGFEKRVEELKKSLECEKTHCLEAAEAGAKGERKMEARLAELKQAHLVQTQKLVRENSELIAQIQALQRDRDGVMSSATTKMNEEISQELQSRIEELKVAQNEIALLKGKAEECDETKDLLEKEKKVAAALRSQVEDIVSQLKKSQKDHSALELLNKSLRDSLASQEKLCSDLTRDSQAERFVRSQKLSEVHLVAQEQLAENQSRINSLEEQLKKKSRDSLQESKALKDKMKQYRELIKKLRFRLEMATIKEKDLEARQEALRQDSVPSQRYRQLQQQLHNVLNKHTEFQAFIQGLGRSQENLSQVEDLNARVTSISERMSELIGHINDAYTSVARL